jgi:hypothetical protein
MLNYLASNTHPDLDARLALSVDQRCRKPMHLIHREGREGRPEI